MTTIELIEKKYGKSLYKIQSEDYPYGYCRGDRYNDVFERFYENGQLAERVRYKGKN